jgi:hypothetical protein
MFRIFSENDSSTNQFPVKNAGNWTSTKNKREKSIYTQHSDSKEVKMVRTKADSSGAARKGND